MRHAMARLASSTTLNFASRGSLARSRPTIDPSIISDEDMAWLLVDAVELCLTGYERTIVFVELGGGESYLVIKRILTALLSTGMALPEGDNRKAHRLAAMATPVTQRSRNCE